MEPLTFRPIKNECVVAMRGEKVAGTIRRYRAHKACIVRVEGLLTPSMAIGKGKATFRTIGEAKARLLELDREQQGGRTMKKYRVTIRTEGNPPFETTVEARDEFKARNPAMRRYPHKLRGAVVHYDVEECGA